MWYLVSAMRLYKKEETYSYTLGVFPTLELLATHATDIAKVYISSRGYVNEGVVKIKTLCTDLAIPFDVNDREISKLAQNENTYAVAIFNKYTSKITPKVNHVVLVNPSDMGNMGTIIRTMVGFDVLNLAVIKPSVDLSDPKVIRASMGALFRINFEYFDSFTQYSTTHQNNIYTLLTNGEQLLEKTRFAKPFTLVFGNEGAGLSSDYLKIGTSVKIAQSKKIDSLNLSVAVGIVLQKTFDQR